MKKIAFIVALPFITAGLYAEGALNGKFAVAEGDTVVFSQGILQFNPAQNIWRFAEHQWDTLTQAENALLAADYDGYIDLFPWGTSGYDNQWPYSGTTYSGTDDIAGTDYDWGVFNAIMNGGKQSGEWRTLTSAEWHEIFTNCKAGPATVRGIYGCVILPNDWSTMPADLPEFVTNPQTIEEYNRVNVYDADQWEAMENAGAVFMPLMKYWTASVSSVAEQATPPWLMATNAAYFTPRPLYVSTDGAYMTSVARTTRNAVRLTKKYVPAEDTPTEINNTLTDNKVQMILRERQLLIITADGKLYNMQGKRVE